MSAPHERGVIPVEHVARAMVTGRDGSWDQLSERAKATWRRLARLAISALIEPSYAMDEAGYLASTDELEPDVLPHQSAWRAMIKAALNEKDLPPDPPREE